MQQYNDTKIGGGRKVLSLLPLPLSMIGWKWPKCLDSFDSTLHRWVPNIIIFTRRYNRRSEGSPSCPPEVGGGYATPIWRASTPLDEMPRPSAYGLAAPPLQVGGCTVHNLDGVKTHVKKFINQTLDSVSEGLKNILMPNFIII